MKTFKYFAVALMAISLASCGGKNDAKNDQNSVTLKVEAELGELANYMSPSDEQIVVKLTDENEDGEISKVIVSSLAFMVSRPVASDYSFSFDVKVLDENHIEIGELRKFRIESSHDYESELSNFLTAGSVRAQMKDVIKASDWNEEEQEKWDKIRTQGVYIQISPCYSSSKYQEYKSTNVDEVIDEVAEDIDELSSSSTTSSEATEDWDALLNSYEQYVDKYISYIKKAANGDMSALTEYPALMEKAQEFSNKLSGAQGTMSSSQWARYIKITNKMATAAQEMQ